MELGLKGKKIIINGGARGIGRATLEILVKEGADVAFFSRHADKVEETKASLAKAGGGKVFGEVFENIADTEAYKAWLVKAAEELGGCDGFVHTASSSGGGGTRNWEMGFQIDVMGAVTGCETLEPYLEKSGKSSIVMLSSTAAFETFIYPQAFNALKAAVTTYGSQLGQLWGPKGIRVNTVSPGPSEFPGGNWDKIKGAMPAFYEGTTKLVPLGNRLGTAEESANAIVFLLSDLASYISGTNIIVDGGYTKRVQF